MVLAFDVPGQPPADPAYERFRVGLMEVVDSPSRTNRWRWHSGDGKWYVYAAEDWVLEDVGIPDTSPQLAIQQKWGFPESTWSVSELFLPDLFRRLGTASKATNTRYPDAVWSPWGGGDWRNAFKRTGPIPPRPPNGNGRGPIDPECERRIKEVQTYHQRGFITYDQQQQLIAEIVAECT